MRTSTRCRARELQRAQRAEAAARRRGGADPAWCILRTIWPASSTPARSPRSVTAASTSTAIRGDVGRAWRRHAVGAGPDAVDQVMTGRVANAFCQVRPPDTTPRPTGLRASGPSNAAIAAHYARARHGAERCRGRRLRCPPRQRYADIFWSDKNLFYGSTHQMPLFPAPATCRKRVEHLERAVARRRRGRDVPRRVHPRILGALHDFGPDLIVISAGLTPTRDLLGGLRLVEADFMGDGSPGGRRAPLSRPHRLHVKAATTSTRSPHRSPCTSVPLWTSAAKPLIVCGEQVRAPIRPRS